MAKKVGSGRPLGLAAVALLAACSGGDGDSSETVGIGSTRVPLTEAATTTRLRVGTVNTWLTSPAFKNPLDLSEDDDIRRADNLVKAILEHRDGFDVVAINEVFDEDVRTELASLLRGEFPYIVKKVDHLPSIVGGEDSGLMLFSKLPFETFPAVVGDGIETTVSYESNTAHYTISGANNIVPAQHLVGVGVDAGAWKSVAAVKVNQGGRRYTIAFTHMQADPGPDDPIKPSPGTIRNTRDAQLATIKDFLAAAGAASTSDKEETLLVGDLNVQGWPGHSSFMPPGAGPNSIPAPNAQMLASEYGVGVWGNIAGLNFFDAWRTSSPEDTGITNIATGEPSRFDYILMNGRGHYTAGSPTLHPPSFVTATAPFGVPQWTRRMLETINSDHIGVATVLGPKGPRSTPALAQVVSVAAGGEPVLQSTFVTPGENHWYRFNRPGTYSFGFAGDPGDLLAYDVFAVRDLARPLPAYDPIPGGNITLPPAECAGTGVCNFNRKVFFSGTSPFYVRIYSPRGRTTGSYAFLAKVHDCSSPEFACALKAGAPPMDPSPPDDKNFTGFFTYRGLATGTTTPQDLSLRVGNPAQQGLDVRITRIGTQVFSAQGFNSSYTFGFPEVTGADYFLSVTRSNNRQSFNVSARTNLTILYGAPHGSGHPLKLICEDETGGNMFGSDELRMGFDSDGTRVREYYNDDFDTDEASPTDGQPWAPVPFVNSLQLVLDELGDGGSIDNTGSFSVPTLNPDVEAVREQTTLVLLSGPSTSGVGKYRFSYNLAHGFDP